MPEFVEQRHHVVVRQQAGPVAGGRHEVAHQESDRQDRLLAEARPAHALVHPRAAALLLARVDVRVEMADRLARGVLDTEEADVRVPGIHFAARRDADAEQLLGGVEQPRQHAIGREIGPQLLVFHLVGLFAQTLGPEGDVPGFQWLARQLLHGFQLRGGGGPAALREVLQESLHLVHGGRHLGGQRELGVIVEAQQFRGFPPQAQDRFHYRTVVVSTGVRALVGGARDPGLVHLAAQRPVLRVTHDGVVARKVQRQHPAVQAAVTRRLRSPLAGVCGDSLQARLVLDLQAPCLGGVEHVFLELRAQQRHFLRDGAEAGPRLRLQRHAGEAEVAQRVPEDFPLPGLELFPLFLEHAREGAEQPFMLADLAAVLREQRQAGVVSFAQGLGVLHGIQVADGRPGARQPMVHGFQRHDEVVPARRFGRRDDFLDAPAALLE